MKRCEVEIPVYEFRPIKDRYQGKVFRYAEGGWMPDDGEYDIAFAIPDSSIAIGFDVPNRYSIIWSWVKNGNWGANVPEHRRGNAWHYMLRAGETEWTSSWDRHGHLNYKAKEDAMNHVCHLKQCSNGVGPEFHINDPYIEKGLVRNRETKEIVVFPDIFKCQYCGDIDWRKEEAKSEQP